MREGLSVSALERVYRERSVDFFRLSLATTADPEFARDAVQEGFARAIRFRRNFRGTGTPEAWVARCVLNAARDLTCVPRSTGLDERTAPNGVEPQLVDHDLRSFIRRLPARQREALFLRFYLDLDYTAIAEALGIEVGTVSATLHAARQQLARAIEEVAK